MPKGGKRENAGRKPKADEQTLIEKLSPMDALALKALQEALAKGEPWAVKLFMEYRFGKPSQHIEQNNTHTINNFKLSDLLGFNDAKD